MAVGELVVSIIGDMKELSKTFSQVQKDLDGVGKDISKIGTNLSSVGSEMTTGVTAPIVATALAIGGVSKEAMGFEKGMQQVFTLLPNASKASMGKMGEDVKAFSKEMGVTTTDVIPALYDAIGSGVPEENVFSFLDIAQKGAVAGVTDIGVAVDTLTSITNAYGQENLKAADASDILFTGINVGKMSYEELQKSLYEVVPTASSLKVGFGDITAALAAMTAQGTPTGVATAQLRQLLVELSKEGTGASDTFKEIAGKSFPQFIKEGGTLQQAINLLGEGFQKSSPHAKELQQKMFELADPTSNIAKEFEGLAGKSFKEFQQEGGTAQQALEMLGVSTGDASGRLSDMFGSIEAGNAVLNLTGNGAAIFDDALKEMENSAGATESAYAKMSDTSSKSLDEITAKLQVAAVEMGEKFLPVIQDTLVPLITDTFIPAIEDIIPVIGAAADAFNGLSQPVKIIILAIVAFIAALGPVLVIAGSVASAIGSLAALFGSGGALAAGLAFAKTAIAGVVASLGTLALPITLVIAAVVALALAWKNNWFDIQGKTRDAVDFIKEKWNQFTTELGRLPSVVSQALSTLAGIFSNVFNNIITSIQNWIALQLVKYTQAVTYITWLKAQLLLKWNEIKQAIALKLNELVADIQTWINNQVAKFNAYITKIGVFKTQTLAKWTEIKTSILAKLNEIISDAQNWITKQVAKYNDAIAKLNTFKSQGLAKWAEIKAGILAKLNEIINDAQNWITKQVAKYNDAIAKLNTFKSQGLAKWAEIKAGILAKLNEIINDAQNWITKQVAKLNDMISKYNAFKTQVATKWTEIKNTIKTKLDEIVTEIKNKATSVGSALDSIVTKIKNKVSDFKDAGKKIMQGLLDGIEDKIDDIKDSINGALEWIDNHLPHSPAKEGPLSRLPNWDAVFVDPLNASIHKISTLSTPLSNALSDVRGPLDANMTTGLRTASNVTTSSVIGDTVINIGPVSLSNSIDLQALVTEINKITSDQRRQRGVFL